MEVHSAFRLHGLSFQTKESLLTEVLKIDSASYNFLKEWFHDKAVVEVKTSGSTGTPKSILLQKKYMVASAKATGSFFNCLEGTKALICLSADFIAGKMMWVRALTLGWDVDLVGSMGHPLENSTKYDFCAMVPLQVENSINKLGCIQKLIIGGAPISDGLHKKLQEVETKAFATYGMTETITHIAVKQLNHLKGKQTYFETLPNVRISLDERSCLVISAPKISEETVVTNDLVKIHSERTFEWLGRIDAIINSGGVKIVPEIVERKLQTVITNRFFVAGLPDEKLGQKVVLIVESTEQKELHQKVKLVRELEKYEVPKEIYFIKIFKETASAKIDKKATLKFLKCTY